MRLEVAERIRELKLDPEVQLDRIGRAKMMFFVLAPGAESESLLPLYFKGDREPPTISTTIDNEIVTEVYEDISTDIDSITSSYLAPCLQLNNYLESSAMDVELDEIKFNIDTRQYYPSSKLRRVSTDVYGASVLISIKSGLDRLVSILSYFYPGISDHTTWGRYKENKKKEGFMGIVRVGACEDKLLEYFDSAYNDWIKDAVAPRDALIHYRDAEPLWGFDSQTGSLVQSHVVEKGNGEGQHYGIYTLSRFVSEWYKLFDHTLLELSTMCPLKLANKQIQPTQKRG